MPTFTVVLYGEVGEIERIEIDINDAISYADLIKKFGYMDADGSDYIFKNASVDEGFGMTIYLELK